MRSTRRGFLPHVVLALWLVSACRESSAFTRTRIHGGSACRPPTGSALVTRSSPGCSGSQGVTHRRTWTSSSRPQTIVVTQSQQEDTVDSLDLVSSKSTRDGREASGFDDEANKNFQSGFLVLVSVPLAWGTFEPGKSRK